MTLQLDKEVKCHLKRPNGVFHQQLSVINIESFMCDFYI